jgi:hypothetical protein
MIFVLGFSHGGITNPRGIALAGPTFDLDDRNTQALAHTYFNTGTQWSLFPH